MPDCNKMPLKKQTIKHKQQQKQNNILEYETSISLMASLSLPLFSDDPRTLKPRELARIIF